MDFLTALAAIGRGVSAARERQQKLNLEEEDRRWKREDRARQREMDDLRLEDMKKKSKVEWEKPLTMADAAEPGNRVVTDALAPILGVAGLPAAPQRIMADAAPFIASDMKDEQAGTDLGVSVPRTIPRSLDTRDADKKAKLEQSRLKMLFSSMEKQKDRDARAKLEEEKAQRREEAIFLRDALRSERKSGGSGARSKKEKAPKFVPVDYQAPLSGDMLPNPMSVVSPGGLGVPGVILPRQETKPVLINDAGTGFRLGPTGRSYSFSQVTPDLIDQLKGQGWGIPDEWKVGLKSPKSKTGNDEKIKAVMLKDQDFMAEYQRAKTEDEQRAVVEKYYSRYSRLHSMLNSQSGNTDQSMKNQLKELFDQTPNF